MSEEPKTRRAFEELLRQNGYPHRLIKKLSEHFPATPEEDTDEDAAATLAAIEELVRKMKDIAE